MKERPILFSAEMVRAILDGRKTQTRRIVKPQPEHDAAFGWQWPSHKCQSMVSVREMGSLGPYGSRGDRLWVRETWYDDNGLRHVEPRPTAPDEYIEYRATHDCREWEAGCPCGNNDDARSAWRPSIHMPRWASRITLEVTGVRVERLQEISEDAARAEGVTTSDIPARINGEPGTIHTFGPDAHRKAFALLWDAINGKRAPWASNPWVWVVEFRRMP